MSEKTVKTEALLSIISTLEELSETDRWCIINCLLVWFKPEPPEGE